jgi:hypothetical protein
MGPAGGSTGFAGGSGRKQQKPSSSVRAGSHLVPGQLRRKIQPMVSLTSSGMRMNRIAMTTGGMSRSSTTGKLRPAAAMALSTPPSPSGRMMITTQTITCSACFHTTKGGGGPVGLEVGVGPVTASLLAVWMDRLSISTLSGSTSPIARARSLVLRPRARVRGGIAFPLCRRQSSTCGVLVNTSLDIHSTHILSVANSKMVGASFSG